MPQPSVCLVILNIPICKYSSRSAMAFEAFTRLHVYQKTSDPKEKDKSNIQCLECYDRNIYIGTKQATVQHLILPTNRGVSPNPCESREGKLKKLGSSSPVIRLRAVPVFNHLLVLWNRTITALNMFSLEPVPSLKKIHHASLFELTLRADTVQMVTCSSQKKLIRLHVIGVDMWEVLKEVSLLQEPIALAVDDDCVCVATCDRYLLCDLKTGLRDELFPHSHNKQHVVVSAVGQGEFLLNGPGSLGMFVMKTGVCQRPPLQWPEDVLAAGVCFPYIFTLQPQVLSVYSLLDQQCKQSVSLSGAIGLVSTSDGALVFTDRDIFRLRLVPVAEQIQALVENERLDEALLLLDGVHSHHPLDSHKELQKDITCLAGFVHFFQEGFTEARDLFIKGELNPRELLSLYPELAPAGLGEDFHSQLDHKTKTRDLQRLWQTDAGSRHRYLAFLKDFLLAVKQTEPGLSCRTEVDCALLWLYVQMADNPGLLQLLAHPSACSLDQCAPVLTQHSRFFALGLLYQSHGKHVDAIQMWVNIVEGIHKDPSCADVFEHIVSTLCQLRDRDAVWTFAPWTLQTNQETGVHIFTKRAADDQFVPEEVLSLLEAYPQARMFYLEFLIHELNSEEEGHHNHLALAYVTHSLHDREDTGTRRKLQQLLLDSQCYDISIVYEQVKSMPLHMERAILLGRTGDHTKAIHLLVHESGDPREAEQYCFRVTQDHDPPSRQVVMLSLLNVYLDSEGLSSAALDLLKNYPQFFAVDKVLEVLPESWSVQLLSHFLVGSLRETFHQRRMRALHRALAQAQLLRHKTLWMQASDTMLRLDGAQVCDFCQRAVTEPHFVYTPSGGLLHPDCTDSSVTPSSKCKVSLLPET